MSLFLVEVPNSAGKSGRINFLPKVLRGFDEDVREIVHQGLKDAGVQVVTNTVFDRIEKVEGQVVPLRLTMTNGTVMLADQIFMAVGRVPAIDGLGLEAAGVVLGKRGDRQ